MSQLDSSRRRLIKNSGVVAGATMIPSKSVWGMCNSSGVSGGSQDYTNVCVLEHSNTGRDPEFWRQFIARGKRKRIGRNDLGPIDGFGRDENGLRALDDAFTAYTGRNWDQVKNIDNRGQRLEATTLFHMYDRINSTIRASVRLSRGGGVIPRGRINCRAHLQLDTIERHLAALYLNLSFGFIAVPMGYTGPKNYMEHVWGTFNQVGIGANELSDYINSTQSNYSFS